MRTKAVENADIDNNYKLLTQSSELRAKGKRRGNVSFPEFKLLCSKTDINMIPQASASLPSENENSNSEIALTLHQFFSQEESLRQYDLLYCIPRKSRTTSASFTPFGSSEFSSAVEASESSSTKKTRSKRRNTNSSGNNDSVEDDENDDDQDDQDENKTYDNESPRQEKPPTRTSNTRPNKRQRNDQSSKNKKDQDNISDQQQQQQQSVVMTPEMQAYSDFCVSLVQDGKATELEQELTSSKKEMAVQSLVQYKNKNWRDYGVCYIAIEQEDYIVLELLLRYIPGLVILTDKFGGTLLHYACEKDDETACEIIFGSIGVLAARFNNSPDSQLYALRLAIDLLSRKNNAGWMPIHNSLKSSTSKTAKLIKDNMMQLASTLAMINIYDFDSICSSWFTPVIPPTFNKFYEDEFEEAQAFLEQFKDEIISKFNSIFRSN